MEQLPTLLVAVSLLCLILAFLYTLYISLIHPFWTIVDCANSQRSKKKKAAWLVALVALWPLPSLVYGFFSGKKALRLVSISYLCVIAINALIYVTLIPEDVKVAFKEELRQQRKEVQERLTPP